MQNLTITILALSNLFFLSGIVYSEPLQVNSQRATGSATASGENATAINSVRQNSHQIQKAGTLRGFQSSRQRASLNSVAGGNNSTAVTSVTQQNSQFMAEDWTNPKTQISTQKAKTSSEASGSANSAVGNIQQENTQNLGGF